jgi:hypothetical protein
MGALVGRVATTGVTVGLLALTGPTAEGTMGAMGRLFVGRAVGTTGHKRGHLEDAPEQYNVQLLKTSKPHT